MPSVYVVPVYVELPEGFERAIATLEAVLQRAGYRFNTGVPFAGTLDQARLRGVGSTQAASDTGGDELSVSPRHRIFLS